MPRSATVVRYVQTVVVLGILFEFLDGGTRHLHLRNSSPTKHGWPVYYYSESGLGTPAHWLWPGLTLDLLLALSLSAIIVWAMQRQGNRSAPPTH